MLQGQTCVNSGDIGQEEDILVIDHDFGLSHLASVLIYCNFALAGCSSCSRPPSSSLCPGLLRLRSCSSCSLFTVRLRIRLLRRKSQALYRWLSGACVKLLVTGLSYAILSAYISNVGLLPELWLPPSLLLSCNYSYSTTKQLLVIVSTTPFVILLRW